MFIGCIAWGRLLTHPRGIEWAHSPAGYRISSSVTHSPAGYRMGMEHPTKANSDWCGSVEDLQPWSSPNTARTPEVCVWWWWW